MGSCSMSKKADRNIHIESNINNDHSYAIGSMMGWHSIMEDRNVAILYNHFSYFAVFDGHGGATCSNYCAENLHNNILRQKLFDEDIPKAIEKGFLITDQNLSRLTDLKTNGTTALCSIITRGNIYIANCGDSKGLLYNGGVSFLTQAHKPNLLAEKERINNAGGIVSNARINWGHGSLGVSRALGDFELKQKNGLTQCQQILSPLPDVEKIQRTGKEEFLILATDGVWDVFTNDALCQYIQNRLFITDDLAEIVTQVIDTCYYKGSTDNITLVLICFPNCPKPTLEAKYAEKLLDDTIEICFREIFEQNPDQDYYGILRKLYWEKNIPNLPPGGGIQAKRKWIDTLYSRYNPTYDISEFTCSRIN
ncbi:unnamed protein product [Brassicogethes aeneus]|uniref:PPM-type phosphatase domain-containing protein n=1 Tax=Brassicogethes aeneus TaxID=1431903 RepID=A0A9P0FLQ4_BRAAE|nr:unnamed protein product [Brassicogethes aeneus]